MNQHSATFVSGRIRIARRGRITPLLLFVITMTFLCGILVINSFFVTQQRVQQQNAIDAAALAAAEVLAQEAFLYANPSIYDVANCPMPDPDPAKQKTPIPDPTKPLFCQATQVAVDFARKNYVAGRPLELRAEDVVFSITDVKTRSTQAWMYAAGPNVNSAIPPLTLAQKRTINGVQVYCRTALERGKTIRMPFLTGMAWDVASRSEAILDGYVYGFQTDPGTPEHPGTINIPLAPLGLSEQSWREQVEANVQLPEAYSSDERLPYGDFKVMIGAIPQDPHAYDCRVIAPILYFGTATIAEATSQFNADNPGITPTQYGVYLQTNAQNPFALDLKTLKTTLPAAPHSIGGDDNLATLESNLQGLKKTEKRLIWPLISGYNDANAQKKAIITGFVAARIIQVRRVSYHLLTDRNGETVPGSKKEGPCDEGLDNEGRLRRRYEVLELTLHPTLLATSTSMVFVQDWPTGDQFEHRFPNSYVKKIRLIK